MMTRLFMFALVAAVNLAAAIDGAPSLVADALVSHYGGRDEAMKALLSAVSSKMQLLGNNNSKHLDHPHLKAVGHANFGALQMASLPGSLAVNNTNVVVEQLQTSFTAVGSSLSKDMLDQNFASRLRSKDDDWTLHINVYIGVIVMPSLAVILAFLTHKPELANKGPGMPDGNDNLPKRDSVSVVPALFVMAMLALCPSDNSPWTAARVPMLFMILGYGIGCQGQNKSMPLFVTLVASFVASMVTFLLMEGENPGSALEATFWQLFPVEAVSSLPLKGVSQATASLGGAAVCILLSPGLLYLSRGAGSAGLFYLWMLSMLGMLTDMSCSSVSSVLDPFLVSLPSRFQVTSFATGIMVSAWESPTPVVRWLGIVVAIVYCLTWQLSIPDELSHGVTRGVMLPVHAMLLWAFMDLLSVPGVGNSSADGEPAGALLVRNGSARGPSSRHTLVPVSFVVLFVLPLFEHRFAEAGLAESLAGLLVACVVGHLIEWGVWMVCLGSSSEKQKRADFQPEDVFLGTFTSDTGIRNTTAFRLLQAAFYYAFLFGGIGATIIHAAILMKRNINRSPRVSSNLPYGQSSTNMAEHVESTVGSVLSTIIHELGWIDLVVTALNVLWFFSGQFLGSPTWRHQIRPAKEVQANLGSDAAKVSYRICTRGLNPHLVADNVQRVFKVLNTSGLRRDTWEVEVVTDNKLGLSEIVEKGVEVVETLVPSSYKCPEGGKFKARALHYAIHNSECRLKATDWVCHLDEETFFDAHTAVTVYQHCLKENEHVSSGRQTYANMGQGMILYNTFGLTVDALVPSLADTCRVGDDLGKFRMTFLSMGFTSIGMHGSFALMNQGLEEAIGFDFGEKGSITEDAWFGMTAKSQLDVGIRWIDTYMYEQSPFTVMDLIRQRARWYHGLYYCTWISGVKFDFKTTWLLSIMLVFWSLSFAIFAIGLMVRLNTLFSASPDRNLWFATEAVSFFFQMNYVIGFVHNYSPYVMGFAPWICLLFLQINVLPIFVGLVEMSGVIHGMYLLSKQKGEFYVVQKEKASVSTPAVAAPKA